jgi:SAM-dependent methyltransferase
LHGRIVEVGAGSGSNFEHYPTSVDEVLAVEPERYLRERAKLAAATASVRVSVEDGGAECLPGAAESFDAGVVALVLCTVPDQQRALAELYRVIRPGGELRFYEHVISESAWEARFQRLADGTFWPHLAGGCHLARDTGAAIEQAGSRSRCSSASASASRRSCHPILTFSGWRAVAPSGLQATRFECSVGRQSN